VTSTCTRGSSCCGNITRPKPLGVASFDGTGAFHTAAAASCGRAVKSGFSAALATVDTSRHNTS